MIQRILIAVDDSPRAPHVLATAVELALLAHATVRVFTAVAVPPDLPPAAATDHGDRLQGHLLRSAAARIEGVMATLPAVPHDLLVEEGHQPARAILAAAAAYDADLIVLGSHGYDIVDRVLGTTAGSVANTSPVDVLVVHRARKTTSRTP